MSKKHYKTGENSKKNLDQFLTYNLDQFLTYRRPNLGPVLTLQHIYIYIFSSRSHKGPTKPKNRANSTKEFSELPVIT